MTRWIQVHYYDREHAIAFPCPYCRLVIWSGNWRLADDGSPDPGPKAVVFQHFKQCPHVAVGENWEFQVVLHLAADENIISMACGEKDHFLKEYQEAMAAYSAAFSALAEKKRVVPFGDHEALQQAVDAARERAEETRGRLNTHVARHGC